MRGLDGLRLTVKLIAEAFNIIQSIGNDNVIPRQDPLHGRVLFGTGILLGLGCVVDVARHAQSLIADVVNLKAADSSVAGGAGDPGLKEGFELEGPCGLARRGVA